jgi:predicted nucleotidyltransferase
MASQNPIYLNADFNIYQQIINSEAKDPKMNRFVDLRDKILPVLKPYVKRISVFGSFARGEETAESDIDLLVELKDPEKRPRLGLGWFGLEEDLSHILGREVELIAEGSLSPYLRPYAEKDKVLLYEEG